MPAKVDKVYINDPFLDRRTKLLPCQREMVHYWYARNASIHSLAKMFRCNRRLIQFELFPERKKKNIELRRDRGGTMIYYNKEYNTEKMKEHRHHKDKVLIKHDFKNDNNGK